MTELRRKFRRSIFHPLVYGCVTGIICGAAIALFTVCARIVCTFSFELYNSVDGPLAVVCIALLALLCCLLTAVVQTLVPGARGSGIPLAEGCARGMLRVKWLRTAAALIAGSMLSFLAGAPLGSEGPSVGMGGLIGEGVGKVMKKPVEFRRYLITGGASAGLAAAFNAPLMGICLAFEETHRRFSPDIFAATLSTVATAVLTSQSIFYGFGQIAYLKAIGVVAGAASLGFLHQSPAVGLDFLYLVIAGIACGIVCAAVGVAFNRAIFALGKLFSKIKSKTVRLLPAFMLSAAVGLCFPLAAGSGEATLSHTSTATALGILCALLALRFVTTALMSGSGATGGLFLPMIAIGGLVGTLAAKASTACGLSDAYAANITVLCICAFFAATVRAPITAIVMSVELTASFANLLPALIAVSVAMLLSHVAKTDALYENMLGGLMQSEVAERRTVTLVGTVTADSPIAFKRLNNILLPYNSVVTDLKRGSAEIVPDGEIKLEPNDKIMIRAENVDCDYFFSQVKEYIDVSDETE